MQLDNPTRESFRNEAEVLRAMAGALAGAREAMSSLHDDDLSLLYRYALWYLSSDATVDARPEREARLDTLADVVRACFEGRGPKNVLLGAGPAGVFRLAAVAAIELHDRAAAAPKEDK